MSNPSTHDLCLNRFIWQRDLCLYDIIHASTIDNGSMPLLSMPQQVNPREGSMPLLSIHQQVHPTEGSAERSAINGSSQITFAYGNEKFKHGLKTGKCIRPLATDVRRLKGNVINDKFQVGTLFSAANVLRNLGTNYLTCCSSGWHSCSCPWCSC